MMCLGDPRLQGMNDTQWVFELEAMNLQDKERYDDLRLLADIVKKQVINMLGLNLLPVEDETTHLLRQPEENECLPLAVMVGRDDILMAIKQRQEEYQTQEKVREQLAASDVLQDTGESVDTGVVEMTPEELDAFMEDEGDVEFENAPEDFLKTMQWGGRGTQMMLENLVLLKDDLKEDPLADSPARTIGKARSDMKAARRQKTEVSSIEVEEVELTSARGAGVKSDRPTVTLEVK